MDRAIQDLTAVSQINDYDSFVLEQNNKAMRLTGLLLKQWLAKELDGHGGIREITLMETTSTGKKYKVTYTDGNYDTFIAPRGEKGEKGDKGDKGDMLTATQVAEYAASASGTVTPSAWMKEIPSVPQGQYLWTRVTVTYTDGTQYYFYSVAKQGRDGDAILASVNGYDPDTNGNVDVVSVTGEKLVVKYKTAEQHTPGELGNVRTVNGVLPDGNYNVDLIKASGEVLFVGRG